ncbi:hypothetical protein [Altererythrobacter sp. Root672]|uniref:hypothetical protein n=1 Tax=Altererythrobacter sp. Root672 TaxID=1736584 RepID=UPI0006F76351|nr:hypothetical protein [Altererythrobacter sp. Root672]KRA83729.1 hypothetical protein ASD76_06835 [Altererythrobacter sp. Root672]
MRLAIALSLAFSSVLSGCGSASNDGRDDCTLRAVEEVTGSGGLRATLSVPEQYRSGVETSNGGIIVYWGDCDFPLNAFLSYETASHIIEVAPARTLTDNVHGLRLVDAELFIEMLKDGSEGPSFFVSKVGDMKPITKPRTPLEAERYVVPEVGDSPL